MSRIELTTLAHPIRQVGSPRNAALDGLQNLCYPCDVADDEQTEFWAPMGTASYANFDRKMLFLFEKPNFSDTEHKPVLQVTERARNTLDCAVFVPVSVSFFQYCAGLAGALKVRMSFEGQQDVWWPEAGNLAATPRLTPAIRYHVIAA